MSKELTKLQWELINNIEDFIKQFRERDIVLIGTSSNDETMISNLTEAINIYEQQRHGRDLRRWLNAIRCNKFINVANSRNIIQDGEGIKRKLRVCEEKNTNLEKEIETLLQKLQKCQEENKGLKKLYGKWQKGDLERET